MKRLIAITTLGLVFSFTSLGSGVAISAPKPLCTCTLSFASLGSEVAIQREGSQETSSSASKHMSLYTKPVAKSDVKNEAIGGTVEGDFMSFYTGRKPASTQSQLISDQSTNEDYTTVFGVRIAL